MAGFMFTWGLYVLMHPQMFTDPNSEKMFSGLAAISAPVTQYPALAWGGLAFAAGISRAVALFINGAYTRTPMIRLIASFVSMFILTQISIGSYDSGVPNPGVVVYPWFVIADLLSAYRAAVDAVHAEKQRHDKKGNHRADERRTALRA
jgi:hypothetical protein